MTKPDRVVLNTLFVQSWVLDADHAIATWIDTTGEVAVFLASCKCGWKSSSASGGLRNWNVEGHAKPILDAQAATR